MWVGATSEGAHDGPRHVRERLSIFSSWKFSCQSFVPLTPGLRSAHTKCAIKRPPADDKLTRRPVQEDGRTHAEHVRLDVHLAPCLVEVVDEAQVELVRPSRVGELARAKLLEERDLVVDAECDEERDDDARNEEFVATNVGGRLPVVQAAIPCVVLDSREPKATSARGWDSPKAGSRHHRDGWDHPYTRCCSHSQVQELHHDSSHLRGHRSLQGRHQYCIKSDRGDGTYSTLARIRLLRQDTRSQSTGSDKPEWLCWPD